MPPQLHSWEELAAWLQEAMAQFRGRPSVYALLREYDSEFDDMELLYDDLLDWERPHARAIAGLISQLAEGRTCALEDIDDVPVAIVAMRIEAAAHWAESHALGPESLIACPDLPGEEMIRWILKDWWRARGRYYAAEMLENRHVETVEAEANRPRRRRRGGIGE